MAKQKKMINKVMLHFFDGGSLDFETFLSRQELVDMLENESRWWHVVSPGESSHVDKDSITLMRVEKIDDESQEKRHD